MKNKPVESLSPLKKTGVKPPGKNVNDAGNKETLTARLLQSSGNTERKTLLNPKDKSQTRNINGHDITFNNLNKIYYPKKKVTKRDVVNYYYLVAPYILPYMKDRPQTLIRYPNGIEGPSFYQKDVTGKVPGWVTQFPYSSERGGDRNFMVCTNEASLLLIASLGGLEMHPWSSRIQSPISRTGASLILILPIEQPLSRLLLQRKLPGKCLMLLMCPHIAKLRALQVCTFIFRLAQNTHMSKVRNLAE